MEKKDIFKKLIENINSPDNYKAIVEHKNGDLIGDFKFESVENNGSKTYLIGYPVNSKEDYVNFDSETLESYSCRIRDVIFLN